MAEHRERPILFSGPMVRAILDGRKTQARRVVTNATSRGNVRASRMDLAAAWVDPGPSPAGNPGPYLKAPLATETPDSEGIIERLYPWVFVGDRLWVRETWRKDFIGKCGVNAPAIRYAADDSWRWNTKAGDIPDTKWRPSIHMPRWASRLTLEVTGVRVERVQDITSAGAIAEGCPAHANVATIDCATRDPRDDFRSLWDSLNAKRGFGWDANPWVWVIEFGIASPKAGPLDG